MVAPKEPLVSVIMNCFNGEEFLREAIDSVYAQTYRNWEIVFWDNASTDGTARIAQSYDEKLIYYRSENTEILGQARAKATKKAKGEYVAFLDSDDFWMGDKLRKQIEIFDHGNDQIGFVYCRSEVIYDDKKKKGYVIKAGEMLPEGDIFTELAKNNFVNFSSVMADREKFDLCGGFPTHFLNSTDYYTFLRLARKYRCAAVQDVCCKIRVHDRNLSAQQLVIGAKEAVEALEEFMPEEALKPAIKFQYTNLAIMLLREKKISLALFTLFRHGDLLHFLSRLFHAILGTRLNN